MEFLDRHAKGQNVELPNSLRNLIKQVHELQKHLLQDDVLWASDMTMPRIRKHSATNRLMKPQYS